MHQISSDAGERISAIELLRRHLEERGFEELEGLTPREKKALSLRFGLSDGSIRTLEEVGRELGVTPERIRLIESKAIRWLHIPIRRYRMRDFLN